MIDLTQVVTDVKLTKACSIKPFKDATESKTVWVEVTYNGIPLQAVFDKSMSGAIIQWQNGPGRTKYTEWTEGQTVKVQFSAPGSSQVNPEDAMVAKLAGMTEAEQLEYFKGLVAKAIPVVDHKLRKGETTK